jgi:cupin fold WbuC family metalloprotein
MIKYNVTQFKAICINEIFQTLNGESGLFYLGRLSMDNNKFQLHEGFLVIKANERLEISFSAHHYCSFTSLRGQSRITDGRNVEINLRSRGVGKVFHTLSSIRGNLTISNLCDVTSIIHIVVSEKLPLVKVEKADESNRTIIRAPHIQNDQLSWSVNGISRLPRDMPYILSSHLEEMSEVSRSSQNVRSRICIHSNDENKIQEMFMSFETKTLIPMMEHLDKNESLILLNGKFQYDIFDHSGNRLAAINLLGIKEPDFDERSYFYVSIGNRVLHSPGQIHRKVIAKETTTGPFMPSQTITHTKAIY